MHFESSMSLTYPPEHPTTSRLLRTMRPAPKQESSECRQPTHHVQIGEDSCMTGQ